jgi:hypothetical protein
MRNLRKIVFKEMADVIPNPLVTTLIGVYSEPYKPLLKKSSSLEEYLHLLDKSYPNLNVKAMLEDMDSLSEEEMDEVNSVYMERKSELDLSENYNLKTSKEVQKSYKNAIKNTDSFDNWNEISNGAEKEREHFFKLHPELKKGKADKKEESFSKLLHKKFTVSIKEAQYIESIINSYMNKRKK